MPLQLSITSANCKIRIKLNIYLAPISFAPGFPLTRRLSFDSCSVKKKINQIFTMPLAFAPQLFHSTIYLMSRLLFFSTGYQNTLDNFSIDVIMTRQKPGLSGQTNQSVGYQNTLDNFSIDVIMIRQKPGLSGQTNPTCWS